jgi:phospholipid/cholesterol/gamma-HCH transport system substrate-binding protein
MKKRTEVIVGAVVLAGIALVMVGTMWLQGVWFGRHDMDVKARFTEVGLLLKGNSVKLRGVPIGTVQSIDLDAAGVIVTMSIRDDVELPEDPVVLLAPESMFGDWQAEIAPREAFAQFAYAESPDPDVMPGYSLPDISRLTAVAERIASNMAVLSDRVELAFTEETALKVRRSVENILAVSEQITSLVSQQQGAIEDVSTELRETMRSVGSAASAVSDALAQVETAVGEDRLVRIVENVEATAGRTAALADTLLHMSRDMRQAAAGADSTLRTVGRIAMRIDRGEGTLGRLLVDTTLFVSLRESNLELQALLRDIRQNPRKYISIRIW